MRRERCVHRLPTFSAYRSTFLALAILGATLLFGCSSERDPDYLDVKPRTLNVGDPIMRIRSGVNDTPFDVDISILESLGTVSYSVDDPYELTDVEYEGVLLSVLFEQFGGAESKSVTILAIDDYTQTIPRDHIEKWPLLLALKANGSYSPRSHRGPVMIIYPYDQYPELDPTIYDPFWVWQISDMPFN